MASIARDLDTVPGFQLTIPTLTDYVNTLIGVISVLLDAKDQEVRSALRSKVAVMKNMREARDALQVALMQLIEKGEKGKDTKYFSCLRAACDRLGEALSYWQ